mgnify:CR=1 FL=1
MSLKPDKHGNITGYVKKEHHEKVSNNQLNHNEGTDYCNSIRILLIPTLLSTKGIRPYPPH